MFLPFKHGHMVFFGALSTHGLPAIIGLGATQVHDAAAWHFSVSVFFLGGCAGVQKYWMF